MVRRKSDVPFDAEESAALARLEEEAEAQASEIYQENYEALKTYVDKLISVGITRGLLGPRESSRIWSRHILNCAALCEVLPQGTDVIDVGSGAGLPGIVVAIARPDLRITLLEPMLRRWTFLDETVDQLDLADRVTVSRGRAEDCPTTYEVVIARAVARLTKLLGWTAPLFHPNGRLLALKGDSVQEEIDEAADLLKASGLVAEVMLVRAHPKAEATNVVKVTRA